MDVEGFLQWARDRPSGSPGSPGIDGWREQALAIIRCAGDGPVWQKHVDEVLRRAEERREQVATLAVIRRVGDALIEYQQTVPGTGPPAAPAGDEPIVTGFTLRALAVEMLKKPMFWRVIACVIFFAIVTVVGLASMAQRDHVLNEGNTHMIEGQCARLGYERGSPELDQCVRTVSRACAGARQVARCAARFVERGVER